MNKFTLEPDSLGSLAGCAFWLLFLALLLAGLMSAAARLGGVDPR